MAKIADNLWDYIEKTDTCWLWKGNISPHGYGIVVYRDKNWRIHRLVYIQTKGEIPDGLVLDHLCRVRHCVNPDHLEPVTIAENTRRGIGPTAQNLQKTECNRGHPFTPENTYRKPCKPSERLCRACRAMKMEDYYRKTLKARRTDNRALKPRMREGNKSHTPKNHGSY